MLQITFAVILLIMMKNDVGNSEKHFRLRRSLHGSIGAPGGYNGEPLPPVQWFKQKLDHSNPSDLRTWKQRYFVNASFYNPNKQGPVFLMIGGEGAVNARWMVQGAWIDYAKEFNALCIQLEHRYYGESHPTEDMSVKNLLYLSSSQALADLAYFISATNDKYKLKKGTRWVAFGGSYPGSLAAWLRLKYPHLVYAAVSSSGPLLAKVDFQEYYEVVVNALREKTGGDDCVQQLKVAHKEIVSLIKDHPRVVEKEFRVCKPFASASANDMSTFYNFIADEFADIVQYNEDNRISDDNKTRNRTINTVCSMLTEDGSLPAFKKLAALISITLNESNQTCLDYNYDNSIKDLRNMTWGSDAGRQWMYQTCTEFGFYQTSSGEVEVFGNLFTLPYFIQQCEDIFGKKYNQDFLEAAARWTNNDYGALEIAVSRVVFVHGTVDPWHALGITETRDDSAPAILIKGTAHCANMYPKSKLDSSELIAARLEIQAYLAKWIAHS